jgi:hypothetical protein
MGLDDFRISTVPSFAPSLGANVEQFPTSAGA